MPPNDKWIFYTDLFGGQRWEKLDPAGVTIAESATGFATLHEAMTDASPMATSRARHAPHVTWSGVGNRSLHGRTRRNRRARATSRAKQEKAAFVLRAGRGRRGFIDKNRRGG